MRRVILVLVVACVAGLATHSAMAEQAPRSIRITDDAVLAKKKKPAKAPASCADNKDKHDCVKLGSDEGECAWCEGSYMPASCMSAMAAKYLPEMVAKCKLPKKHKEEVVAVAADIDGAVNNKKKPAKAPASCADNKDKRDCLKLGSEEGDCAWCEGEYMPASCMSAMAAKYLPETVAKCKLPKKHKDEAVVAAAAADDGASTLSKKKKPAKAPASCADNKDKHDCVKLGSEEGDCAWCVGEYMPASCMSAMAAKYLPETVAKCKLPKKHKDEAAAADTDTLNKKKRKPAKAPASCADNKDKRDCLKLGSDEGECAWCEGGYMPASCMSAMAAKYLPEMVAKCKLPKKHKAVTADPLIGKDDPKPKAPSSCGDNKEKGDCLDMGAQEGDCAWCKGDLMPPSCVGLEAAKWIPETVAHCKLPKGKKGAEDTVTNTKINNDNDQNADESAFEKKKKKSKGGDWPSGGGDWPSGGGDWPSGGGSSGGGGDYPYGPGGGSGGQGVGKGCKDLRSRHKCMKGSRSEGACAWCAKGSMVVSEGCVPEQMIKWLPKMVADCEVGKDRRKKASVQVS